MAVTPVTTYDINVSAREEVNVSKCYPAAYHGVAKIYSELVALKLLYTMMAVTKVESDQFSLSGSHI